LKKALKSLESGFTGTQKHTVGMAILTICPKVGKNYQQAFFADPPPTCAKNRKTQRFRTSDGKLINKVGCPVTNRVIVVVIAQVAWQNVGSDFPARKNV